MLKLLMSACRSPRALFLAGVVLALSGAVNPVRADVTLKVDEDSMLGVQMPAQLDGLAKPGVAGRLTLDVVSGSTHFNNPSSLYVFCIELNAHRPVDPTTGEGLATGGYLEKEDISSVPKPGGGGNMASNMGALKAALFDKLFDQWFTNNPTGWLAFTDVSAAAFQLAIWEILYDGPTSSTPGDLDIYDGNFLIVKAGASALQKSVADLAQTLLDALSGPSTDVVTLLAFSHQFGDGKDGGYQDLITTLDQGGTVQSTPVPPAAVLALAGLASLGGFGWRRRKQPSAG